MQKTTKEKMWVVLIKKCRKKICHHYRNKQVEKYKKLSELVKNSAEDHNKFTKTYMPAFHFFPFYFFIICPVINSSTLFGLKQLVVTGTHACFLSIYCTRRLHRNIVIRASPLNSAALSPLQFLAMHIV